MIYEPWVSLFRCKTSNVDVFLDDYFWVYHVEYFWSFYGSSAIFALTSSNTPDKGLIFLLLSIYLI